uniref:BLVR domain-containing protein n=1 Tax=Steinernema glaseri TaxID=37863 RepID=A0A1I8ALN9_9BILA
MINSLGAVERRKRRSMLQSERRKREAEEEAGESEDFEAHGKLFKNKHYPAPPEKITQPVEPVSINLVQPETPLREAEEEEEEEEGEIDEREDFEAYGKLFKNKHYPAPPEKITQPVEPVSINLVQPEAPLAASIQTSFSGDAPKQESKVLEPL